MSAAAEKTVRLRDGQEVAIRPIQPDDKPLIVDGFNRMSEESRMRRFLTPASELTHEDLIYLTEVDHKRHEAMVAIEPFEGRGVGAARYVRVPGDRETAEVAVAVVDDWQQRGVATALMYALAERARENGIERFTALVSPENRVVLNALTGAGAERVGKDGGEIEFTVEVPEDGLGDRLRDALRAAGAGQLRLAGEVARRLGLLRRGD
jgi:RimJ/RimL family protein N-acetyltransferase